MKASDKPEISKKWWVNEKPDDIKGADLEKALAAAEKALADADKKKGDADAIKSALASLASLTAAIDKTIKKECDKKKDKDLITVLGKFYDLIDKETEELNEAQDAVDKADEDGEEEDEDEEAKGVLKEEYLDRMIKQLRSGNEVNFCFGLNRSAPQDSRLVLCNKRKPERLHRILKKTGDFSNRLMTFGSATGDGKVLEFNLSDDAKEPSQIAKLAKVYLKNHRDLKFRKLRVLAGGQTFEEDMPDGDEPEGSSSASSQGGDLQQQLRIAKAAESTWKSVHDQVADQISQLQRELSSFDDPSVTSVSDGLNTLLDKLQDPDFGALSRSTDQSSFASELQKTRQRMNEWRSLFDQGGAFQAIDENPFVKTDLAGVVGDALSSIGKELQIA